MINSQNEFRGIRDSLNVGVPKKCTLASTIQLFFDTKLRPTNSSNKFGHKTGIQQDFPQNLQTHMSISCIQNSL